MSKENSQPTLPVPHNLKWTQLPHVAWADINGNQVMIEVAVMALDRGTGDLYFIRTDSLDDIDKRRLIKILSRRDAAKYPLWDLMSQVTLQNGMNALEFFQQLVKVRSVSGQIFAPNAGMRGMYNSANLTSPTQMPVQNSDAHIPGPDSAPQAPQNYAQNKTGRAKKGGTTF